MKKFSINLTTQFKKDLKKFIPYPSDYDDIVNGIQLLEKGGHDEIPAEMKPHRLQGKFKGYWECHVHSDLLLIWQEDLKENNIYLIRVGSHSNLFN